MYIVIAGGGAVGQSLARALIAHKHDVVVVDQDRSVCEDIASRTGALVRLGNATDIEVLEEFEGYHTRACRCASFAMGRAGLGARGVGFGGGGAMSSISVRRLATLRTEFPDTLAVEPALVTDASGRATWTVRLADSLTTWLVQARAISRRGGLGGAVAELRVEQPFSASAQLPPSLVSGDVFGVPIEITKSASRARRFAPGVPVTPMASRFCSWV